MVLGDWGIWDRLSKVSVVGEMSFISSRHDKQAAEGKVSHGTVTHSTQLFRELNACVWSSEAGASWHSLLTSASVHKEDLLGHS